MAAGFLSPSVEHPSAEPAFPALSPVVGPVFPAPASPVVEPAFPAPASPSEGFVFPAPSPAAWSAGFLSPAVDVYKRQG